MKPVWQRVWDDDRKQPEFRDGILYILGIPQSPDSADMIESARLDSLAYGFLVGRDDLSPTERLRIYNLATELDRRPSCGCPAGRFRFETACPACRAEVERDLAEIYGPLIPF